jgi:hypothetical protein
MVTAAWNKYLWFFSVSALLTACAPQPDPARNMLSDTSYVPTSALPWMFRYYAHKDPTRGCEMERIPLYGMYEGKPDPPCFTYREKPGWDTLIPCDLADTLKIPFDEVYRFMNTYRLWDTLADPYHLNGYIFADFVTYEIVPDGSVLLLESKRLQDSEVNGRRMYLVKRQNNRLELLQEFRGLPLMLTRSDHASGVMLWLLELDQLHCGLAYCSYYPENERLQFEEFLFFNERCVFEGSREAEEADRLFEQEFLDEVFCLD